MAFLLSRNFFANAALFFATLHRTFSCLSLSESGIILPVGCWVRDGRRGGRERESRNQKPRKTRNKHTNQQNPALTTSSIPTLYWTQLAAHGLVHVELRSGNEKLATAMLAWLDPALGLQLLL